MDRRGSPAERTFRLMRAATSSSCSRRRCLSRSALPRRFSWSFYRAPDEHPGEHDTNARRRMHERATHATILLFDTGTRAHAVTPGTCASVRAHAQVHARKYYRMPFAPAEWSASPRAARAAIHAARFTAAQQPGTHARVRACVRRALTSLCRLALMRRRVAPS